ncbi:hypothetical protein [Nocardia blacklockiae]|uniref:hypothetical protein n=1 Tax=Nocardia blacklockiae TaxID=480036 RepID=UPI00189627FE|nr:hypothetical protein [Nocardia blacklockiae]MBF6176443.1 hypothetical protein [Nocardia blacklockiae]
MNFAPAVAPEHGSVRRVSAAWRVSPIVVAAALIASQLVLRGWVAGSGYFYWDDLILVGRAGTSPLLSAELLLHSHDGHFMPLAFVVAWVVTALAPLNWAGPVVSLLVLQCVAAVAVLRMLLVLDAGRARTAAARPVRWIVLLPFVFYLFCPLTLPSFAWWAAGLNALPLQAALAWVIGDAVLLVRTGRRRYAVSGVLVFAVGLLFFEKCVVIPFVACAVAALSGHLDGRAKVLRRGAPLWLGSAAVLVCWAVVYFAVLDTATVHSDPGNLRNLLHSATSLGIVPTLLGGPWAWARWLPSTPWAVPPTWAVILSWLALALLVALTVRFRARVVPVWILVAAYIFGAQLPVALIRGGPNTAAELMQSLRYLADVAVVLAAAGALLLRAPRRPANPAVTDTAAATHVAAAAAGTDTRTAAGVGTDTRTAVGVGTGTRTAVGTGTGTGTDTATGGGTRTAAGIGTRPVAGISSGPATGLGTRIRTAVGVGTGSGAGAAPGAGAGFGSGVRRWVVVGVVVALVGSSLWSTVAFARSWEVSPTRTYLTNVEVGLAAGGPPLLDQEVPWGVLTPLAYPQNLASRVLSPVAKGAFADSTPRLRMITDSGELVPAQVWWNRGIRPGPEPGCGYRVAGEPSVDLPLDGPMLDNGWTAQLNYFADRDGRVVVGMEHGRAVSVPVRAGLNTVFVRLVGSGSTVRIASRTPDLTLCVGAGPVGVASYDR